MDHFRYRGNELFAEDLAAAEIADAVGTPCFVYSRATLERHYRVYREAFGELDGLVCFAVKANSNLAVLNVLARLGSGFDIVSGGELERVLAAGGEAGKTVFSGPGKSAGEIRLALAAGIRCFNIESAAELERVNGIAAETGKIAAVSLRINPDVDAGTHPYIATGLKENKFGIAAEQALALYEQAARLPAVEAVGIDCHIGSQLTSIAPYLDAIDRLLPIVETLREKGTPLRHFDIGGGLGVRYGDESPPRPDELMRAVAERFRGRGLEIIIEPGRSIVANAGIFVTRVEYLKSNESRHFAIVDGGMNDLLRPALYGAWQDIIPLNRRGGERRRYDIVGPVCESADFLGKARALCLEPGDLLAVRGAGAYGFVMSSNYNSRGRAAEVMVDGGTFHIVREREDAAALFALESMLPRAYPAS